MRMVTGKIGLRHLARAVNARHRPGRPEEGNPRARRVPAARLGR
jgi:hypothetical protein